MFLLSLKRGVGEVDGYSTAHLNFAARWPGLQVILGRREQGGERSHQIMPQVVQVKNRANNYNTFLALPGDSGRGE